MPRSMAQSGQARSVMRTRNSRLMTALSWSCHNEASALLGGELRHADGWLDDSFPVLAQVFRRATLGRDILGGLDSRHHLDGVPRADGQFVGIGLLRGNVDAHFAADTP